MYPFHVEAAFVHVVVVLLRVKTVARVMWPAFA